MNKYVSCIDTDWEVLGETGELVYYYYYYIKLVYGKLTKYKSQHISLKYKFINIVEIDKFSIIILTYIKITRPATQ